MTLFLLTLFHYSVCLIKLLKSSDDFPNEIRDRNVWHDNIHFDNPRCFLSLYLWCNLENFIRFLCHYSCRVLFRTQQKKMYTTCVLLFWLKRSLKYFELVYSWLLSFSNISIKFSHSRQWFQPLRPSAQLNPLRLEQLN